MSYLGAYGVLSTAVFVSILLLATSVFFRCRRIPSTGPVLPPTILLEAALAADRFSSSEVVSLVRFILHRVHVLFSIHHEIVSDVSQVERVFVKQHEVFDLHPMSSSMLKRIFGCDFNGITRNKYAEMHDGFMKVVSRDFVNDSAVTATLIRGDIGRKVSSLVSFSAATQLQHPWERFADTKVISMRCNKKLEKVVETDLENLLRGLSFYISIPLLYGHDYLDRNPSALSNWDCFGEQVPLLALGVPTWLPMPSFQRGIAARDRLVESISSVYRRTKQYHNGEAVDHDADMSDVSETALDRYKVYERHGVSIKGIGQIELSLLWAQNKNTQQLLFWYIFYIYSVPGLLETLRHEVTSSGVLSLSSDDAPQITKLDVGAIGKECPLLKSTFLESFRISEESVLFRRVTEKTTLDDGARQYQLRPGSWLSISTNLSKHDASIYPRPREFLPGRFVEESSVNGGQKTASYKTLRPWGLGPTMCKGRTYAEKQLLAIAASIIVLWDMEQVGGEWQHPGFRTGATILAPATKVRVRIKRRAFH